MKNDVIFFQNYFCNKFICILGNFACAQSMFGREGPYKNALVIKKLLQENGN